MGALAEEAPYDDVAPGGVAMLFVFAVEWSLGAALVHGSELRTDSPLPQAVLTPL